MKSSRWILAAKCVAILSVIPVLIQAYSSGPPERKTGAPGDQTCAQTACHVGTAVNGGPGKIDVTFEGGLSYAPGQKKRITVKITGESNRIFGFQMSSRPSSDTSKGQAGSFTAGTGTQILCEDGTTRLPCGASTPLQFIEHSSPQPNDGSFQFDWTAPTPGVGDVKFYVAVNSANGNGTISGDRIYTTDFTMTPAGVVAPRPTIDTTDGVVNGASFRAGIQSGSWVTIRGNDLAPTTRTWDAAREIVNGVLPTELDGVKVNINGKAASVYFISPKQINVQAPTDAMTGNVPVEVINRNGTSTTVTAQLQAAAPAFFLFDPENRKYLAAVHSDGTFLGKTGLFTGGTTRPAKPGDTVLLFGTGFGPTDPAVPAGRVFTGAPRITNALTLRIGNVPVTPAFVGLSNSAVGLYQFNVVVPDLPNGDHAVVAETGGLSTQPDAFITIQR